MADGGMTLNIDEPLAERLREAAKLAGQSVEVYARQALEAFAEDQDDRWAESIRRLEEYDRTGEYVDAEEALAKFRHDLEERLQQR